MLPLDHSINDYHYRTDTINDQKSDPINLSTLVSSLEVSFVSEQRKKLPFIIYLKSIPALIAMPLKYSLPSVPQPDTVLLTQRFHAR